MADSRADNEDVRQIKVINAGMGVGFARVAGIADIMMYRGLGIARSASHIVA